MTDPKNAPITFGSTTVHRHLAAHAPDLAVRVVDELAGQLPAYAALPLEELRSDIVRVAQQSIRAFVDVLRSGEPPDERQLAGLRESAARRAEEGLPLDAVISAYHLGARVCMDEVSPLAGPGDLAAVLTVHRLLLQYLQRVTAAGVAGYVQERQTAFGEEHSARQALLDALLDAVPAQDAADRAGLRLPACYLVLSLSVAAHRDERTPGVDPAVAGRRKLRRLRVELERHVRGTVLSSLSVDGGLVLVPAEGPPGDVPARTWAWLDGVLEHAARVCGASVTAGAVASGPDAVADAARLAADVRKVAAASGRPPGTYRLADVLLEYQLTRPGPALDQLAALVAPLAGRPELLATLRAYLAHGMDRRGTARSLRVHPNTLDYRLRRVTELTGLDAARPADAARVRAALAAYDAVGGGRGDADGT
ncbi:helix-turn-helix domain-containing protein [Streptomyces sp. TRM 70351]|uniref:PucR family transcriptional regulator n=1 Tax=Streptomyces sp. TRM 70351 TaxID=3116552 RepID=UPI002E7B2D47|nr:helix-turn-helix domain-containing protein [Streptomyces sp. TRM 70351]MEE1929803.1 helix-turn-helix domain-containing protein [Streptomyces sp. TRM 70351]